MQLQASRRDSKTFVVVDEDCGIPTSVVENYRAFTESGPLAQADPRSYLLSMSEYHDSKAAYDVYDYQTATRPEQGHDAYGGFAGGHPAYSADYVATQAQVPSGLPQSSTTLGLVPSGQHYGTHDRAYYGHQATQYPAYLEAPRPVPEITNWTPRQGQEHTTVTVYFQSVYDFDAPRVTPVIMFGTNRVESVLRKSGPQGQVYAYSLSAEAPSLASTNSPSPTVPMHLMLDDGSITWDSPSLEFGDFTYLPEPSYYQLDSPQMATQQLQAPRKRKLSPEASPRNSPTKKPSMQNIGQPAGTGMTPLSPFRRPSVAADVYNQSKRMSGTAEYHQGYGASLSRMSSQQYYGQTQASHSPSWQYQQASHHVSRSPSAAGMSNASRSSQLLPSPAPGSAPPLIRTSTLQQSPTTPGARMPAASPFNPYTVYPSNAKAMLKIDGDLNTMSDKWTSDEWEVKRRLVQFRRSQVGSVITATFEPVTPEDRIPNSICVSCIWWEEKQECYVTSVDTISLLESLVAVRFTVEEKNRIRRNLEGFRPATVSKTKQDSEEFFKLIMGFPNPKPRNIEKDVKVFPWRILGTALKKIIGKYSASYSSTAGLLPTPGASNYLPVSRASEAILDPRPAASPRSTSSSATSHGHAYAAQSMQASMYPPHAVGVAGLGIGPSAGHPSSHPDLRLAVPTSAGAQTTSWHQPSSHYTSDMAAGRGWDFGGGYMGASPAATGLPGTAPAYPYQQRIPSLTGPAAMPAEARFVPLHDYEGQGQPTSTS
ncbi:Hypothetical predicted protein [Lecanosticta acicola]|uniref:DUF7082 domain-containing protein n=1 Tax=Lecanosticta acicola TaxID=111012 RepID=A0AAI8Z7L8_9PEZI|nr:Hypothetical predicted protein [Lecanosticta acicola]